MATQLENINLRDYDLDGFEFGLLIHQDEIQEKVKEISDQINDDYENKLPVIIGVLNGSFLFMADLVRHLSIDFEVDFIKISSYGNSTNSSGTVRLLKDISADLTDRNVIVVEDIVDTGLTIEFLYNRLMEASPLSLKFVTCLLKPVKQKVKKMIEYTGFEISDSFVVGYGLDYAQKFRGLPSIYSLKEKKDLK